MPFFKKAYDNSKKSIEDVLPILRSTFSPHIQKTEQTFHPFDFYLNDDKYFELKERFNNYSKYPTTMIGKNKIEIASSNPDKEYYFLFKFNDGLYYIKYDDDKFSQYEISTGGRKDRGYNEYKSYCYIPICDLIKLTTDSVEVTTI